MPIDHLLAALERDGSAQAEALLTQARTAATAIARESDELVARRRTDALDARKAELSGAAQATLGETRRTSRGAVLAARQRLLERVFAAARDLFPEATASEDYRARALPRHLAEALGALGDEPAVIRCPEVLVAAVRSAVARTKHLTVEGDAAAPPGIRVVTTDGVIEVDNTLEGRLDRLRAHLALDVLAQLEASP